MPDKIDPNDDMGFAPAPTANNKKMIDVVIPYLHHEAIWNELIFTVRSIEKNLKHDHRITLIGDAHPALNIPNIYAYQVKKKQFAKAWDSIIKLTAIVNSPDISDDFIYCYDDIILLQEIDISFFNANYCMHDMAAVKRRESNNYSIVKWHTYDVLRKLNLPTFSYETHLPRLFNKQKMKFILDKYTQHDKTLLMNSLYTNYYFRGKPVELFRDDHIKAGFYGPDDVYSFGNKCKIDQVLNPKTILSYNNKGLTPDLKKSIISRFKEKSKYETKG